MMDRRSRSQRWRFGAAAAASLCLFLVVLLTSYHQGRSVRPKWRAKTVVTPHVTQPAWLLATMSPVGAFGRRIVVRNTWQRLYRNDSRFDTRFVISNATSGMWWPHIKRENDTYGDIVMLEHLNENRWIANTIKPMEFMKALVDGVLLRPYSFVSKIDDDSFLDATRYFDKYLQPLMDRAMNNKMDLPPTVIGKKVGPSWPYPAGAFYTLTWNLVEAAVAQYKINGTQDIKDEDALTGKLIIDSGIQHHFQHLPPQEAFDFMMFQGAPADNPWAQSEEALANYWHSLGPGAINVHQLKSNYQYLQVSSLYDEHGIRMDEWSKSVNLSAWFKTKTTATDDAWRKEIGLDKWVMDNLDKIIQSSNSTANVDEEPLNNEGQEEISGDVDVEPQGDEKSESDKSSEQGPDSEEKQESKDDKSAKDGKKSKDEKTGKGGDKSSDKGDGKSIKSKRSLQSLSAG